MVPSRTLVALLGLLLLFLPNAKSSEAVLVQLTPELRALYLQSQRQPDSSEQLMQQLLAQSTDPLEQAQLHYILAQLQVMLVYPDRALDSVGEALMLVDEATQPWLYHNLQLTRAYALDLAGTPADGMAATEAALQWAVQHQHKALELQALVVRGVLHLSLVNYVAAMQDLLRAYQQAPTEDELLSKGHIAGFIALVYEYRRENELAIPYFEEAVAFHQRQHNPIEVSIALFGLGKAYVNLGDLTRGTRKLEQSLQLANEAGDLQGVAYAQKELAGIYVQQQQPAQARQLLEKALESFQLANNQYMLLDGNLQLARIALQQDELAQAELHLTEALRYAHPQQMPIQYASIQLQQAEWLAKSGQTDQAYQLLKSASERLTALNQQESTQLLHQLRAQHESDSRALENQLLQKELEIQHAMISSQQSRQRLLTLLLMALSAGSLILLLLISRILWQRKQLRHLANYDSLTRLPNRRYTLELLEQQLKLASRYQFPLTIAMLDLDYFKQINDQFGHATGDQILRDFAALCQSCLRSTDVTGRIGGEEFLAVFPHTKPDDAALVLEHLRQKTELLAKRLELDGIRTSVSIGYSSFSGYDNAESLLLSADQALYQAKAQGRNQLAQATVSDNEATSTKINLP